MPGLDLNSVVTSTAANGDYGVYDPVNAWTDAKDIIVSVMRTSTAIVQIGFEKTAPNEMWIRSQMIGGEWGDWTALAPPPTGTPQQREKAK